MGHTSFDNSIAAPHPESLTFNETFIGSAILKYPVMWGDKKVRIIFLICVMKGKNDVMSMIYESIPKLIKQPERIQNIVNEPTYENLIRNLEEVFEEE